MAGRVKDTRTLYTGNTDYNTDDAFIRGIMGEIYTAEAVVVIDVLENNGHDGPPGFVNVLPLVSQIDAYNNIIESVKLFRLPYYRYQAGAAAIVVDPKPGDIGIAVYMKRDSSDISVEQTEPIKPNTFRSFDQSDGFYIGGFYNKAPSVFIELDDDGTIDITSTSSVTINTQNAIINCNTANVEASSSATISSPQTTITGNQATINAQTRINGNLFIAGGITWTGNAQGEGGTANFIGTINATNDVTANGISLNSHVHGGVESGSSTTEAPQ